MMSYTMSWTCLWSKGSTLMRRTSPCTRIIGGRPDDRCRSEALFLTENASSWVMSMGLGKGVRPAGYSPDYGDDNSQHTTSACSHCCSLRECAAARAKCHAAVCQQDGFSGCGA